ncbi:VOC family protein [Paraburkholderia sp. T12-10]|nr:VOC family protein [Paraburkholderia sp. T12-10]
MISHVCIGVNDFNQSFAFYSAIMDTLGLELKFSDSDRAWAGWMENGKPRPLFVIGRPLDGKPAQRGNGQTVGLLAPTRASVDKAHAAALANGATCEGAPGLRPQYHPDYYGAYFRDFDGNKICVCCHEPE